MGTINVSPTDPPNNFSCPKYLQNNPANCFATEFRANFSAKAILASFQKGSNSGNDVHPHFFR